MKIIDVTRKGELSEVRIRTRQLGSYVDQSSFTTSWPEDLLYALADLKGEWFYDSYQRFEHSNYVQKSIDFTIDFNNLDVASKRILDFGFGFGASSYCLIKRGATNIVATELEESNTAFAEKFFTSMQYDDLIDIRREDMIGSMESESFDIVWLQAVVEHLLPEEREEYLQTFWRALTPGGCLVISEVPNSIWPVEVHTTGGQWFIPWMTPAKVFHLMRQKEEYQNYSDEDFYRSGIIGSSYKQILNQVNRTGDCIELSLFKRNYLRQAYDRAISKSLVKSLAVSSINVLEPVVRKLLKRPMTAFMPFLNHLVFQKSK